MEGIQQVIDVDQQQEQRGVADERDKGVTRHRTPPQCLLSAQERTVSDSRVVPYCIAHLPLHGPLSRWSGPLAHNSYLLQHRNRQPQVKRKACGQQCFPLAARRVSSTRIEAPHMRSACDRPYRAPAAESATARDFVGLGRPPSLADLRPGAAANRSQSGFASHPAEGVGFEPTSRLTTANGFETCTTV